MHLIHLTSATSFHTRCQAQVMEHVAAELGLDPAEVKRRNFIARPDISEPDPLTPAGSDKDKANGSGDDNGSGGSSKASNDAKPGSAAKPEGSSPAAYSVAADGTPEVQVGSEAAPDDAADASAGAARQRPCFAGPAAGLASGEQVQPKPY